ncbi:hypothetical protein BC828DRAFT_345894 [Blastocladiella britannica]|nr:hypothetical protein BC828DRAFT_345894 [Blastocladiella britannica]
MSTPPLQARLLKLAKHQQFPWFVGHVLTVLGLPLYVVLGSVGAYYRALLGAMVAYGVVLYRQHAPALRSGAAGGWQAVMSRASVDLNTHYFGLAGFFWMSSYPCIAVLVPYTAFSLFHTISYSRDTLLPAVFPPPTPPPAVIAALVTRATAFATQRQPQALQLASYWELTATPLYLILQVLTWRQSFFAPIFYAQFMVTRYMTSGTTRAAATTVRRELDGRMEPLAARADVVGHVGRAYIVARNWVGGYLDKRMSAGGAGAPAGQPSPAQPRAQ